METSSDEEGDATPKKNGVLDAASSESEKDIENPETKLRKRFNTLISKVNVKTDSKLNSEAVIQVERLSQDQSSTEEPIKLESGAGKKPAKKSKLNFDAEINRLCDLGALSKLTKKYSK